jgi:hypothetical protein
MMRHVVGNAPEQQATQSAASVGGHDDQIRSALGNMTLQRLLDRPLGPGEQNLAPEMLRHALACVLESRTRLARMHLRSAIVPARTKA